MEIRMDPISDEEVGFLLFGGKMKKYLLIVICLLSLLLSSPVLAKTKAFIKEYTYQASEFDSKASSRILALEQVKRLLLEELGTYLESNTEVKNYQLTKDQIVILTAGIVRAEIIDEKWDGKTYYLKAKITSDPKDVANSIDKLRQDRQKTKELEDTRKKADELLWEIERIKRAISRATMPESVKDETLREVERLKGEMKITKAREIDHDLYNEAINRLSAIDWYQKGFTFEYSCKRQQAIEAFTNAIELDRMYARAYFARGSVYHFATFGCFGVKVSDSQHHYPEAIKDYDRAIELDPKLSEAYYLRANAYESIGNYRQAVKDYDMMITLNPKDESAYYGRASGYYHLGDYNKAIADFDQTIKLYPEHVSAHFDRGRVYAEIGDYRRAIQDYEKAIVINPRAAEVYIYRGLAYGKLGNQRQEIENYKAAAQMGLKSAQDYLRSKGISW